MKKVLHNLNIRGNDVTAMPPDDAPDDPEEGEPCWWRCINGHWMYGTHCPAMAAEDGTPEGERAIAEICPFCYVEWIGSHVPPMKRVDG